jgi:hypothetical protein
MDVELENLMNLMLYEEGEAIPVDDLPPVSTLIVTYTLEFIHNLGTYA